MKKITLILILLIINAATSFSQYQIIYNTGAKNILNFASYYNNHDNNTSVYLLQNGDTGTAAPPSWIRYLKNINQWQNSPHTQFLLSGTCYTGTGGYQWSWIQSFIRSSNDTNFMIGCYNWTSCYPIENGLETKITYNNGISATLNNLGFYAYDIDPQNDSINYGVGNTYLMQTGFWKSTNKGINWTESNLPFTPSTGNYLLKVNPLKNSELFLIYNSSIYRSTNFGSNFTLLSTIQGSMSSIKFDVTDSSIYYTSNSGIYKSTNHGLNWTQQISNLKSYSLVINPDNHNILYAGTIEGIYSSTNNGLVWSKYFNDLTPSTSIVALVKYKNDGDTIYAATTRNVYKIWGQRIIY